MFPSLAPVMDSMDLTSLKPVCRKSMDSVDIVRLEYWKERPWIMSTESMDSVHWVHGHCPVWLVSLDFVHGLTGQCPLSPWTMSTETMDSVHSVTGLFPWVFPTFLAHLSRRLTRWAYRMGLKPASVRASTISNMNISETSNQILHHWGGGKAALGFGADQIRTLVSMATDSSHRVIMGKRASSRFLDCFWSDPFYTCKYLWHT